MSSLGRVRESPHHALSSSFRAWSGGSLTRPRLDISHRSARGGEILLLSPGWTSLVVVRRVVGRFSYSPKPGHLWSLFDAWWGDSLTRLRLDISGHHLACGGEILLLAPSWTSLVVIRHMVGRFSYSPQAGHLWSSFGAWWGDSHTRPRLDIFGCRLARGGEILLVVVRRVVGRYSLTQPRLDISGHRSARGGEFL